MNISKKILRLSFIVFFILWMTSLCHSQQASGLYYENYSGIHGVVRNPAFGQHGKLAWDINLGSMNLYAQNNYAYANQSNLFHFLNNLDSLSILGADEQVSDPDMFGIAFYQANKQKQVFALADIMGPSAWVNLKPIGVGIFTRMRAEGSIPRIPTSLGYYQYKELPMDELQSLREIQGAGAVWSEIGINLSTNSLWYDDSFSLGINIKYIIPYEGIYGATTDVFNFTKSTDNQFIVNQAVADLSYTSGIGNLSDFSLSDKGHGLAFDIGLSKEFDHLRLGISIVDIGKMSFTSEVEHHRLVANDLFTLDVDQLTSQSNISAAIEDINIQRQNAGFQDSTLVNNSFSLRSPTRLNINVDYKVSEKIYINSALTHNLATGNNAIHSENNVAISPRYESRWFTISTPFILSSYETVRLGISTRLGILTVGTDDLFSLFGKNDFNGSSVYAALKINPFGNNKNGKNVKCPKIKRSPWDSSEPVRGANRMRSPG